MAKKTPKGAVKLDLGLNKTKGGVAKSKVVGEPKPKEVVKQPKAKKSKPFPTNSLIGKLGGA